MMTKRAFLPAVWIAVTLAAGSTHAQTMWPMQPAWTQTAGPNGAIVTALAADGDRIYACIHDEVHRFDHATGTWVRTGSLGEMMLQHAGFGGERFLVDGDRLIGTTRDAIIFSDDGGATWTQGEIYGALFRGGSDVYVLSDQTVLRLEGDRWTTVGSVPHATGIPTVFGSTAFTATLYASDVFRSDDGMRTWRQVELDLPAIDGEPTAGHGVTFAAGGAHVYASVGGAGIVRSRDGNTWERISDGLPEGVGAQMMYADDDELVITTNDGVHRFDGTSWSRIDIAGAREVVFAGDRTILATYGGMRTIASDGRSTESMNGGLIAGTAGALSVIGDYVLTSTSDGMYRTTDHGSSWHRVADFMLWTPSAAVAVEGRLFAASGALHRSDDSGATWRTVGPASDGEWNGSPYRGDINAIAASGGAIYLAAGSWLSGCGPSVWASGGVFRSSDGGETWHDVSSNLPRNGDTYAPSAGIAAGDGYLLLSNARGLYRSTDEGASWRSSMAGLPYGNANGFGEIITIGRVHYLAFGADLFESSDGGRSWRPLSAPLPSGYRWSGYGASIVDGRLYTLVSYLPDSITYSTRLMEFDGTRWTDITGTMPPGVTLQSFARAGDFVFAGTFRHGVWRTDAAPTTSGIEPTVAPALAPSIACFPVPARRAATVRFSLTRALAVALRLVDTRGTVVHTGPLETLSAGTHERSLDLGSVPAGRYVVQVAGAGSAAEGVLVVAE